MDIKTFTILNGSNINAVKMEAVLIGKLPEVHQQRLSSYENIGKGFDEYYRVSIYPHYLDDDSPEGIADLLDDFFMRHFHIAVGRDVDTGYYCNHYDYLPMPGSQAQDGVMVVYHRYYK